MDGCGTEMPPGAEVSSEHREQEEVGRDGKNGWWGKGTPGGWHHPEPREAMHCIITWRQSLPLLDVA